MADALWPGQALLMSIDCGQDPGKLRIGSRIWPGRASRDSCAHHAEGMDRPRCAYCGEVIAVYEPMPLILSDGGEVEGSRLTLRAELESERSVALHQGCYRLKADRIDPRQES
jgi:hypothetical protein